MQSMIDGSGASMVDASVDDRCERLDELGVG
jgi:hypothetical protein